MDAAQNRNLDAVRLMLRAGWPPEARGQHGATALHWAAFHGHAELTALILGFQPPLEAVDADFGGTPLGWAIHGSEKGGSRHASDFAKTVASLLHAGAKLPKEICGSLPVQAVLREFTAAIG